MELWHLDRFFKGFLGIAVFVTALSQVSAETQLSSTESALPTPGNVFEFRISPDASRVVYSADQNTNSIIELFSVPIGGGAATEISDIMIPDGDLQLGTIEADFQISPDSARVVYRADQDTNDFIELHSVPLAGGAITKLSGLPDSTRTVQGGYTISPDGSNVVYVADQSANDVFDLYSVPITGGTPTKLSNISTPNGDVPSGAFDTGHRISPDGLWVVFNADQDSNDVFELYSVAITGGPIAKLNGPLPDGGDVAQSQYRISPDSTRVVYVADQTSNDVLELFSVPINGGAQTKLNGAFAADRDVSTGLLQPEFEITPDSSQVIYHADQDSNDVFELYRVAITGGPNAKLNGPLVSGGRVEFYFGKDDSRLSPDGNWVVYLADQATNDVLELYSVATTGGVPIKLNASLPVGGDVIQDIRVSPDSSRVVYRADQNSNDVIELYSCAITGGIPVRLNGDLVSGGDVQSETFVTDFIISPNSMSVVYRADQDADNVVELYSVPITGGTPIKLNGPMVTGGDVNIGGFRRNMLVSSDSMQVVYAADQNSNAVIEVFSAEIDTQSVSGVIFEWVTVGDPGNSNDVATGLGSVSNTFRIAKHEVSNDQYVKFLNAKAASDPNGLYNTAMGSDVRGGITRSGSSGGYTYAAKANMGNKPVNYVSFFDAMRFVNWLENSQGSGDTESGVYNVDLGTNETRAGSATYFIPTVDEWYKAAYYDPVDSGADGNGTPDYWEFPTQSDAVPTIGLVDSIGGITNDTANIANHSDGAIWNGVTGNVTTVGSGGPGSESHYGAADMGGNVQEWNETITGSSRGGAGGAYFLPADFMRSLFAGGFTSPTQEVVYSGIRIGSQTPASALDLSVNKTVNTDGAVVFEGHGLVFYVTVSNLGPVIATAVVVTDVFPPEFTNAVSGSGDYDLTTWNIGTLGVSASTTLTVSATVPAGSGGTSITNIAALTAVDQIDTNSLNNVDNEIIVVGLVTQDFGDAPSPYPTQIADGGAVHDATGPFLGATRDFEADGQPSVSADGDDANGIDDEDGVVFGIARVGQLDATATITASTNAKLDAWVDFNNDGSWGGPYEQIADNLSISAGNNTVEFDVPSWAQDTNVISRFRISSMGDLGYMGSSVDGEVEDHQIELLSPLLSSGNFETNLVDASAANATTVIAADVDKDGDMDVVAALPGNDSLAWYENTGNLVFSKHIVTSASDVHSVFPADFDGDGHLDFATASVAQDEIAWFKNDGSQNFTTNIISTSADSAYSVFVADVDGDGDQDILSASRNDDKIAWYDNDGSGLFTTHIISTAANNAYSVYAADVDSDGDMDVLSASFDDDSVAWYENDGSQGFTEHLISTSANGGHSVFAIDVDGDGDVDVLSASYNDDKVAWYENDGNESFTAHTISTGANGARSVSAADVDGDGDIDVLSAAWLDDEATWYENDGNENFTTRHLSTSDGGVRFVFAADVDGDGQLDVLSASSDDDNITLYNQVGLFDWGDAAAPYPTLLANNGARHGTQGPRLGADRDSEVDGQPGPGGNGDDLGGSDDEDGVSFGPAQVGQLGAIVAVTASAPAKLDAWIDFNNDGSWGGPFEQIADTVAVTAGHNTILYDIPSWAVDTNVTARFRLSSAGNLGQGGEGVDGEIEDYQIPVLRPDYAAGIFLTHTISSNVGNAADIYPSDIDADGDMDVVAATVAGGIVWYENDGEANFLTNVVATSAVSTFTVLSSDIDGDGDLDILSASFNDEITWHENDGNGNFTANTISTNADAPQSVFAADVDRDGDVDVLSASSNDDTIAWYENDGSQNFATNLITTTADNARAVYAADVDSDGDMDVLSASLSDHTIAWYENDGNEIFTTNVITTTANGAIDVFACDLDRDGDVDVLSASFIDDKIAWYENDGSENFTTRTVTLSADSARSVFAADLDGDGDMDILAASADDDTIAWYENDGSENFTTNIVTSIFDFPLSVFAADVDGDGDMDVLSASGGDNTIAWYEQIDGFVDIALDKSVDDPSPDVGDSVLFTVTATNQSGIDVTGVVITDVLPIEFVSATVSNAAYDLNEWTVGNLDAGASTTLTVLATVGGGTAGATITNTATLTALDQVDTNSINDSSSAEIDVQFNSGVSFDWVTVGNAGNAADANGFGEVTNRFKITKYEVRNDQYAAFLNAKAATDSNNLFDTNMSSDVRGGITRSGSSGSYLYQVKANMGDKPVVYVDFLDAMRFVNWLHNGQGNADTETGVYTIGTGLSEVRAGGALFFIPTEDEWHKAAYHDPDDPGADAGGTPNYWLYSTQSDTAPTGGLVDAVGNITNDSGNVVNYNNAAIWNGVTGNVATVGSGGAGSESHYGAADMSGSVWEWNETLVGGTERRIRGGSWDGNANGLRSTDESSSTPGQEFNDRGFRIACPLPPLPVVEILTIEADTNIVLTSTGTNTYELTPEYATNLLDVPLIWVAVPGFTNIYLDGTNTTTFDIPGTNLDLIYIRIKNMESE